MAVRETVDARKTKYGSGDIAPLFVDASEVVVAKGKTAVRFDPKTASIDDIEALALGRSGNLRAPTIRVGKRVLVGFADPVWVEFFG